MDERTRRLVGRTCRDCEKRRLGELSESELAGYARDPFLSGRVLRQLFNRRVPEINEALASRGAANLQPSLAAALAVDADTAVEPLEPYWPQYRRRRPPATADRVLNAAAPAGATATPTESDGGHRRVPLWVWAGVAAALVALVGFIIVRGRDDSEDVVASPSTTLARSTPATAVTTAESPPSVGSSTAGAAASTLAEAPATPATTARTSTRRTTTSVAPKSEVSTTIRPSPGRVVAGVTSTSAASTTVAPIPTVQYVRGTLPTRWAEYSDGIVYLRGRVPNQQTADEITEIAVGVVGRDNVRVEYVVDPTAPLVDGAPLYVRDAVPFDSAIGAPAPESYAVLDLGVALLEQNPAMSVEIGGHTDDQGSAEYNIELSRQRAQVVYDYLVSKGVDPAQLAVRAYGESQPIAGNDTAAGRAANRRIELSVFDLLG